MTAGFAFLPFPAANGFIQAAARILGEEGADIGIVFELRINRSLLCFFLNKNLGLSLNRVAIRFARITFQPFLKRDVKRKRRPDLRFEKSPVFFGTDKRRFD